MICRDGVTRAERTQIQRLEPIPGSAGCQPAVVGSLPTTPDFFEPKFVEDISAGCQDEQASGLCSPDKNFPSIRVTNNCKVERTQ